MDLNQEKNGGRKTRDTFPLKISFVDRILYSENFVYRKLHILLVSIEDWKYIIFRDHIRL